MKVSGPLAISASWAHASRADIRPVQRTEALPAPTLTLDAARERLDAASAQLRSAFGSFTATTRPTYTRSLSITRLPAALAGLGARVTPFDGGNPFLKTTLSINTQTSTNRSSSETIGLDLATAVSRLDSAALGLDVTSAAAASRLESSAALGLNLTPSNAPPVLRSAAPLGLDVTSAQSASSLTSSAPLGLDVTSPQSASTIVSTAEVNTALTSYTPSVSFASGTSVATLSGTFTGVNTAATATSLQVKLRNNATLGSTAASLRFEILNQAGVKLYEFDASYLAGDRLYLGDDIGLSVVFSAGTVVSGQIGTSAVTRGAADVDPAATFNNVNPNLRPRFDNGAQITAGSFTINGTSIAVNADDSINSVVARINSSAAGVTASFANDKLTLTSNGNSEDHIYLANGTSGFLAAMKLIAPNEEINTASTSYGSNTLTFGAGNTSVATLSGVYSGAGPFATATSLIIRMRASAANITEGAASAIKFDVNNQSGQTLFSFDATAKAGDKIALGSGSGLWVQFSAGSLLNSATATTTVSKTTKTDVDPAATFNSSDPNLRPRFERNAQVTAGSFTVNGTSVAVNANDSINSVIARINATVGGVTASFANDRISIVNNAGSNPVVLASDTSGFLAATKLAAAVTAPGNIRDDQQVLSKTAQFAGVTTGAFTVNGASISVNRDTDTLNSVISRINASAAGVLASYDAAQDRVVLTGTSNSEDLITVAGDTSGFLAAAGLSTGNTVRGNLRDDQQVLAKTTQFAGVTSGSFTINGVGISLNTNTDSVSTLVSRINAAGAGVTAAFDTASDRIMLAGAPGSLDMIAVGSDSTGFLAAAGLESGNTVFGDLTEDYIVLTNVPSFGSVTNGSFEVDGRTITVDVATDTVRSLADKINASGARVVATYDAARDRMALLATYDSEDDLPVGNDTSGFLVAARLAADNTVKGNIRDDQQVLSKTSQFAGVASGSFTINGRTIDLDAERDTVTTLVEKINGADAGVTAVFDAQADTIRLANTADGDALIIVGNDTTGFVAAAGLDTGNTVRGKLADHQRALSATASFAGMTSGSVTVNGVSIAVDADQDTLETLLGRINGAGAGVTANYSTATDTVTFTPGVAGAMLALEDDTTGFLARARVASGAAGTRVNANAAFNGTGANAPLFDPGVAVQAGSFTVNGVRVSVAADDTIATVLDRIAGSGAGVTATYDDATQTVTLTGTTITAGPVVLADDTSGFLAAVKFDGTAASGRESVSAFEGTLSGMAEYAGVIAGTVTVNGQAIAVDPATTSVRGLVAALNDSGAVSATLDTATGRVAMTSLSPDGSLTISDTSGLLGRLGVTTGAYDSIVGSTTLVETRTGTATSSNATEVAGRVLAAIQQFNDAVSQLDAGGTDVAPLRSGLRRAVQDTIESLGRAGVTGVSVSGDGAGLRVAVDHARLAGALNRVSTSAGLSAAIGEALDRLAGGLQASTANPAPNSAPSPAANLAANLATNPAVRAALTVPPTAEAEPAADARLKAHQAVTALLFLRPFPQAPTVVARKAAHAYAGGPSKPSSAVGTLAEGGRTPTLLERMKKDLAGGTAVQQSSPMTAGLSGGRTPAVGKGWDSWWK